MTTGDVFEGASSLSLDAKGRLAIPARHREPLAQAGGLVLTAHPDRCLVLYPQAAWQPIRQKILALPSLDKRAAGVRRLFVGMATTLEPDAAGRILVSPELRQFARLEKTVWLVGQGTHFEVWSDAGWQLQQEAMLDFGGDMLPAGLEDLTL